MVATIKGYHLILTMPETMSLERRNLLKALGAQIVLTDGLGGMAASIAKAQELRDSIPGSVILQQFENPSNAAVHERTTGEEIWRDTDGEVAVFVAGVGTGGTICGVARALKNIIRMFISLRLNLRRLPYWQEVRQHHTAYRESGRILFRNFMMLL